jgi:processive 1,2-diacylglycerol beta-glucosyltransferase
MKVLILTCKTGQGHNSSAAAIKQSFDAHGITCDIADNVAFMSKLGSRMMDKAFTGIYLHMPKFFDKGYGKANFKILGKSSADMFASTLVAFSKRLRRHIEKEGYTHVICVHLLSAVMISAMNKKKPLGVKTSFLSTDYTMLPFIETTELDQYFMPHRDLAGLYTEMGLPSENLVDTGIPVRSQFLEYGLKKEEARQKLDIPIDAKVVFIMGGSMGCGPIEELVRSVAKVGGDDLKILVSCGTNDKLLHSLSKLPDERITAFRYSDNVPGIMTASDVFVTKPGGISITEAGVMAIPTVLLNSIGGCETPNFNFFISHGFAEGAVDVADAARICSELLVDPERCEKIRVRLRANFSRHSADEIAEAVISTVNV